MNALHRFEFILQHKSDSLLRQSIGVGFGQIQIMRALHGSAPLSQRAAAQKLFQTEANISRQLQLLKKKGLVSISRDMKDKRLRQTALTANGIKTYEKAEKLLAGQYKELLKLFDADELKTFDQAISRLLKAV